MKAKIFERVEDLNAYLQDKKQRDIQLLYRSFIVGEKVVNKEKVYEIVDRFLVLEK